MRTNFSAAVLPRGKILILRDKNPTEICRPPQQSVIVQFRRAVLLCRQYIYRA